MAHGIITGCGGEMTCESELGKGTTFNIYLPGIIDNAQNKDV